MGRKRGPVPTQSWDSLGAYLLAPPLCPIRNPQIIWHEPPNPVEDLLPGQQKEPGASMAPLPPNWNGRTKAIVSTGPLDGAGWTLALADLIGVKCWTQW